jgi:glycerol-3-phosphate dehydrogenase
MAPVPGHGSRFVFALPQPDGRVYVGLTDEPADGDIPDVPEPSESEIWFLLDIIGAVFARPLRRDDVVGAFAGLRPLLAAEGSTADLSRRHAVLESPTGVVTIVGGKLTTYRRMAEHAVDAAVRIGALTAAPCRTRDLPLVGAADRTVLAALEAPERLVRRYGTEAFAVLHNARAHGFADHELLAPVAEGVSVTPAELLWGLTHEGALDADDLLDRRSRVGLIPADRALAEPVVHALLERSAR